MCPHIAQARATFAHCLLQATQDANSALYNATLLAISVTRHNGTPTAETATFTVVTEADYYVNVTNGDQVNKETMASSATIDMSPGGPIFGHSDIKDHTPFLVRSIHLMPGDYILTAEVFSKPGAYITIVVSSLDFSTIQ